MGAERSVWGRWLAYPDGSGRFRSAIDTVIASSTPGAVERTVCGAGDSVTRCSMPMTYLADERNWHVQCGGEQCIQRGTAGCVVLHSCASADAGCTRFSAHQVGQKFMCGQRQSTLSRNINQSGRSNASPAGKALLELGPGQRRVGIELWTDSKTVSCGTEQTRVKRASDADRRLRTGPAEPMVIEDGPAGPSCPRRRQQLRRVRTSGRDTSRWCVDGSRAPCDQPQHHRRQNGDMCRSAESESTMLALPVCVGSLGGLFPLRMRLARVVESCAVRSRWARAGYRERRPQRCDISGAGVHRADWSRDKVHVQHATRRHAQAVR